MAILKMVLLTICDRKGSAEAVYYIKDDSMALVGVNRVNKADIIDHDLSQ